MLTHERLIELLDYDPVAGLFRRRTTIGGRCAGTKAGTIMEGNIKISVDNKNYLAPRLAWFYVHGEWPEAIYCKDKNRFNYAIDNLDNVSLDYIRHNKRRYSNNPSGSTGIYKMGKRWRVYAGTRYVCTCATKEEAIEKRRLIVKQQKNRPACGRSGLDGGTIHGDEMISTSCNSRNKAIFK